MRLGTWNCQSGILPNWESVAGLGLDLLTVQECEPETAEFVRGHEGWTGEAQDGRWRKGVGVLAHQPYEVVRRELLDPTVDRFAVSALIGGPSALRFVGFWAMTPKGVGYSFTRQASLLIDALPDDGLPTVVAGDFNASRSEAHRANVKRLEARGLVSAYHRLYPASPGKEAKHTSYYLWRRSRPYHMDFVFVPAEWPVQAVSIGDFEDYPGRRISDHVPLVVEAEPPR